MVVETFADGVPAGSARLSGTGRCGLVTDFSGDIFAKVSQQPNATGKDFTSAPACNIFEMQTLPGQSYDRIQQQISLPIDTFNPAVMYLVCRPEHANAFTSSVVAPYTLQILPLPVAESEVLNPPAYAKPYIDTGDTAISVLHVYGSVSPLSGLDFELRPNYSSSLYADEISSSERFSWLCSVIFSPSGLGGFLSSVGSTDVKWLPKFAFYNGAPTRVTVFTGLAAQTNLSATATIISSVPPSCNTVLPYSLPPEPVETSSARVAIANAMLFARDTIGRISRLALNKRAREDGVGDNDEPRSRR
jgi:hypothetical protein